MTKKVFLVAALFLVLIAPSVFAASDQHGAADKGQTMKMPSIDVFADGVHVTFMVMKNENHKTMLTQMKMNEEIEKGTTHNIMVLVRDEKTGKEYANKSITITVTDPDDNEQMKKGSYKDMMRTYDGYFKMSQTGKYQIKVLFEIEGKKRSIGIAHDMV
ncbi:MAG: hypothetical protein C0392_09120 [Syntrophus sp. (in: bacteria)]|nr:hypothetical protein [Syntrophus sp. (in: bacteria)]